MMIGEVVVAAGGGWLWGAVAMTVVRFLFPVRGWTALNYRGERIPLGYGLLFVPLFLSAGVWLAVAQQTVGLATGVLASAGMGLAGWFDDRFGANGPKGLRGHIFAVRSGVVTTGMIKVLAACCLAILAASIRRVSWSEMAVDVLLIMLATNLINLLDLRPGRALKGSGLLFMIVTVGTLPLEGVLVWACVMGCIVAVARDDLHGRAMLGDTGANALGFLGGVFCMYSLGLFIKVGLLVLFGALHLYAEQFSITAYIERNRLLRRLDEWGRARNR